MKTQHPASLRIFFATEMWERYGFYVVQTLLAIYLAQHFKWNDKNIYELTGSFTALTYVSPIIGGFIADHLLGQKRTIIVGGIILLTCYLILGLVASDKVLIFSLAGIAVGTGLFKPNISSLLGNEYPINSPRRENGFTIFYMGITTGIIFGCIFPSQLNYYFGWPFSFSSAALGMLFGLSVFIYGIYQYKIKDYAIYQYQFKKILQAVLIVISLWLVSAFILHYSMLANFVFIAIILISLSYFVYSVKHDPTSDAHKTMAIGILCLISVIFWTFYFQMFLSFTLFLTRVVDPTLFGIQFPPPYYVSIQSFFAIIFGLFFARQKHNSMKKNPGILAANKFMYALIFIVSAFALTAIVCSFSPSTNLLSPLYFIPAYMMISVAELLLYPVGLSIITVLSSRKKVSTMMGMFFVSLGVGGFMAGKVANLAAIVPGEKSPLILKAHYASAFSHITYLMISLLLVCALLNRLIKYLLVDHSVKDNAYMIAAGAQE